MMLATWLVEMYLSKINTLDDIMASEGASHDVEDLRTERGFIEDDLRQFLETYKVGIALPY
jgi:vacuolar protein sorting-associated protein 18